MSTTIVARAKEAEKPKEMLRVKVFPHAVMLADSRADCRL
jgi:hypothetical protein